MFKPEINEYKEAYLLILNVVLSQVDRIWRNIMAKTVSDTRVLGHYVFV